MQEFLSVEINSKGEHKKIHLEIRNKITASFTVR